MTRRIVALLSCLALSACGVVEWPMTVSSDESQVSCSGSNSKDREANERQCRTAQTDAQVQRQQTMHDHGMSTPQP